MKGKQKDDTNILNDNKKAKIKQFMQQKKRKMEKQKLKEDIKSREEADRMKQNLRELSAKTYLLATKVVPAQKQHSQTSKLKKFVKSRPEFTLERY